MILLKDFMKERRWIILTFALGFLTLATAGYIMFREIYRPKKDILSTYGYLFEDFDDTIIYNPKLEEVTTKWKNDSETCQLTCPNDKNVVTTEAYTHVRNSWSPVGNMTVTKSSTYKETNVSPFEVFRDEPRSAPSRAIQKLRHGCCISFMNRTSYNSLMSYTSGKTVCIIQFKNRRQLFATEVCEVEKPCRYDCKCKRLDVVSSALVVDATNGCETLDEKTQHDSEKMNARIELVEHPGWCKCLNY